MHSWYDGESGVWKNKNAEERDVVILRPVKDFKNFKLRARDGDVGKVREFYFDDKLALKLETAEN